MNSIIMNTSLYNESVWPSVFNNTHKSSGNFSMDDDSANKYEVPTTILVFLSMLYGTISVLAVVGNALVMWIIATSRRMQTVKNYYIANLAFADIIIGLFAIPFQFQAALLQRWNLPYFMCAFCPFIRALSVNVSIFTLTAIAIDRHKAILKPLSARPSKHTAKIFIVGIWIVGVCLATPSAVAQKVVMVPENRRGFLVLSQYLIPLSIISCVYARMTLKLWSNKAPGNAEDSRDVNLMRNKMRVIKMFLIVVALFAICWLPLQTYYFLQFLYPEINVYEYINYIWFFCDSLAMSNSCCNPFIYGIYNEKFRREFKQRCPFLWRKWSTSPPTNTTDTDKTQSTRTSIRYEWRRTISGTYPNVSSFYKGAPTKESSESFIADHQLSGRSKRGISCYIRSGNNCSRKNEELYVFSSDEHQHTQEDLGIEELCL